MWSNVPDTTKWVAAGVLVLIGAFCLFMTYGALITSVKHKTHVSGAPFVGGVFVLVGFLLSPIKLLALLALIDPGPWLVIYGMWKGRKAKKESEDK